MAGRDPHCPAPRHTRLIFLSPDQFDLKSMEGATTRYRRGQAYAPADADLKAFAGDYKSDELKTVLHMTPGKGALMGRMNEQAGDGYEFKPVDRETFQLGMVTMRFRRDTAGKVVGLDFSNPVLRQVKFTRLSDAR
jgi:hypothetical protein